MSILKRKAVMIIGGALAVILVTGGIVTIYAKAAVKVDYQTVEKADMDTVLELNGSVVSAEKETIFAETSLKVDKVLVKEGDEVKKGDLLVSFDQAEIEKSVALLELNAKTQEGNYLNSIQTSDKFSSLYSEATRNLNVLNQQIADTEEAIINKQREINERSSYLANDGAQIQVKIVESAEKGDTDEVNRYQKLAYNNTYVQSYDSELLRLQEELSRLNTQLADFKTYKAEMTSQKASSITGILTEGGREQLEALKETNEITNADELAKLEIAKDGIRANFDGVISSINVEEGGFITAGTPVITVDSLDDVCIRCNANKYDIMSIADGQTANISVLNKTYTGEVTRIEKIAGLDGTTSSGVGVDIKLDDAEDIILGLDVKAKVNTASVSDVVCVPREAIVTDDDENSYVFVEKDKKAVKTKVETGISTDEQVEIVSGLNVGDTVVWNSEKELKNGEDVRY